VGPAGMKLYAFSSGGLTIAKSALQAGAPSTQVTVPVGFFVVKHPKGNFLFDTGNNDKIISDPTYWGPFVQGLTPERTPDIAIDAKLKKIGLSPDDISTSRSATCISTTAATSASSRRPPSSSRRTR